MEKGAEMATDDALVGLRFEVGGGLGRMSGEIVGKVGALYLIRKDEAEHLELLEIDDLRSAKFYPPAGLKSAGPGGGENGVDRASPSGDGAADAASTGEHSAAEADGAPAKTRLAERMRRAAILRDAGKD